MAEPMSVPVTQVWEPPPHTLRPLVTQADLWLIQLDLVTPTDVLSWDERRRLNAIRNPTAARHFLAARSAMRDILGRYLDTAPAALQFDYLEGGKPVLKVPHDGLRFNLSHCRGQALLALTTECDIGVDLEIHRRLPHYLRIAARTFPPHLLARLNAAPQIQREALFFDLWTELEATHKALGRGVFGVAADPAQLSIAALRPLPHASACIALVQSPYHTWHRRYFDYHRRDG